MLKLQDIENHKIVEVISGSHSYNLNTSTSDLDIRGIYKLPNDDILGLYHQSQINDNSNDIIYYEIGRFIELASKCNPNILELLWVDEKFIKQSSDAYDLLRDHRHLFLSKQCAKTFGGYAIGQIKKARGLNKKIVNPVKERKSPAHFCYLILDKERTMKLLDVPYWKKQISSLGVTKMQNGVGLYRLYGDHNNKFNFRGLIKEDSNELRLSSIPVEWFDEYEESRYSALIFFDLNAYKQHCKDYREYQEWVDKRNSHRYNATKNHGKGYDSKNLMHTFRLLNMGIDIAKEKTLNVFRTHDREFLMKVRAGEYEYDDLLILAEKKLKDLDEAFESSDLPDEVNLNDVNSLLVMIRNNY